MKLLIVSDIHANWPALRAVLESESDADRILCLGDLVNYGPQPAECVAWAKEILPPEGVIQGNHDRAVGLNESPHGSPAYAPLAEATQPFTSRVLTPEMKDFLAHLQPLRSFELGGAKCAACHTTERGPLSAPRGSQNAQWSWESDIVLLGIAGMPFALVGHPDVLFLAHSHTPVKTSWGKTLVVNPGSVGLPTDGEPQAAYAIWEDGEVTLRRVPYDVEETIRAYDRLGLETQILQRLCEVLRTGGQLPADVIGGPVQRNAEI